MLTDRLESKFMANEPIFTYEIENLYPDVPRSSLFRQIKEAVEYGALRQFVRGVYYLPSACGGIRTEDVIRKRYIGWGGKVYGTYSGVQVINHFCQENITGVPVEIVTNNETSRGRIVSILGREYIIKKSRCEITADNANAYMLVQLFDQLNDGEMLSVPAKKVIMKFISRCNISRAQVIEISSHFTARPIRNLEMSGIMQQIA
ncbi:MAG: hypothetical protein LUD50_00130 [Clostridia bacterium]|nr:hypothetical protein [Clostridia bacterium]